MVLDESGIRKRITDGGKRAAIQSAVQYQERIRFHVSTQTRADAVLHSRPLGDFLAFVKNLLPADKYRVFKSLLRFPLKTNELTGCIFDKLYRVFDGRNPVFNYQFTNGEYRDDWEYYRKEVLHEPEVWQQQGWDMFKTDINSVLVCDLPQEREAGDRYPRPYFYWLPIGAVLDFEDGGRYGTMQYLIFRQDGGRIAVIDGMSYRTYTEADGNIGTLLSESPHGLDYCPARFFWLPPLDGGNPYIKEHPLARQLEMLDWYLFFHTAKHQLDIYGSYPIYSGYEPECDYASPDGETCDGGFLKDRKGFYEYDANGLLVPCPKCGHKRIIGPGSYVTVPAPGKTSEFNEIPDMRNPVQMLAVDRDSLDYNVTEEERLKREIIESVTGTDFGAVDEQAFNELQVNANFESQNAVLNRIKKGFESAQQFVDETICRLRYGNAALVSARVNYGTEFFLLTAGELRSRYKTAKESGASEAELDALQTQIVETEYRNDPVQVQRMLMLSELEPYRHLTRGELVELYGKGLASREDVLLKIGFSDFIRRFERENTNILEFGVQLPFDRRINVIRDQLKQYANESDNDNQGGL